MSETRRARTRAMVAVALAAAVAAGCGEQAGGADAASAAPAAPAPVAVTADRSDLVFRYVDPGSGKVATATAATDVPAEAAREVVVLDPTAPPAPGWELVVDLSAGLPTTATPTRGFVLKPRPQAPPSRAAAVAAAGGEDVVLFVREGCGFCRKARKYLKSQKVAFAEHDLDKDPHAAKKLARLAQKAGLQAGQLNGVPIIFVGDQAVMGFDKPRLDRLLKKSG